MRMITLRQVMINKWQLFNDHGDEISLAMYFTDRDEAIAWANAWVSSFSDVSLRIEEDLTER